MEEDLDVSTLMVQQDTQMQYPDGRAAGGARNDQVKEELTASMLVVEQRRAQDRKALSMLLKKKNWTLASFRAFLASLFEIDYTQLAFVPPVSEKTFCSIDRAIFFSSYRIMATLQLRTALIMCIEMSLIGIGNNQSTAFRLGALYVGLTDPNGSFSLRLRYMGLALLTTTFFGAVLPGLTWQSPAALLVTSFFVALLTGLSAGIGTVHESAMRARGSRARNHRAKRQCEHTRKL